MVTEIVIAWAAEDCGMMLKSSLAATIARLAGIPVRLPRDRTKSQAYRCLTFCAGNDILAPSPGRVRLGAATNPLQTTAPRCTLLSARADK